jgi:hypothetical protein
MLKKMESLLNCIVVNINVIPVKVNCGVFGVNFHCFLIELHQ